MPKVPKVANRKNTEVRRQNTGGVGKAKAKKETTNHEGTKF
jgi:hypothetical protein